MLAPTPATQPATAPTASIPAIHPAALVVWFLVGLVFLSLLLDYAPKLGAMLAALIVIYLGLKVLPQLQPLAA